MVVLACESLHVCTVCIWRCEHARVCVEAFLSAIYTFSFIHSFIHSLFHSPPVPNKPYGFCGRKAPRKTKSNPNLQSVLLARFECSIKGTSLLKKRKSKTHVSNLGLKVYYLSPHYCQRWRQCCYSVSVIGDCDSILLIYGRNPNDEAEI